MNYDNNDAELLSSKFTTTHWFRVSVTSKAIKKETIRFQSNMDDVGNLGAKQTRGPSSSPLSRSGFLDLR